jgi:hypothetical protein
MIARMKQRDEYATSAERTTIPISRERKKRNDADRCTFPIGDRDRDISGVQYARVSFVLELTRVIAVR